MENGILAGDTATKGQLLNQMGDLRNTYASIGDKLAGRMPLAYAHFVQILVDTFVLIAPLALYADLGYYSVIAFGILTLFYTGLLLPTITEEEAAEAEQTKPKLQLLILCSYPITLKYSLSLYLFIMSCFDHLRWSLDWLSNKYIMLPIIMLFMPLKKSLSESGCWKLVVERSMP